MDENQHEAAQSDPVAPEPMDRRRFLTEAAGTAGVATVAYFWLEGLGEPLRRRDIEPTRPGAPTKTFDPLQWRTLAAACDRLLPTEKDSPGAKTVNAIGYLDALLAESFVSAETRSLILDGAARLHRGAQGSGNAREFARLTPKQQDGGILALQESKDKAADGSLFGHKWLKKMLGYIFEAFFGDPVHGGNPQEVAWKWARHRPGIPRPTDAAWKMTERDK